MISVRSSRILIALITLLWLAGALSELSAAPTASPSSVAAGDESVSTHVINPLDKLLIVVYAGDLQTAEYQKVVQSDGSVYLPYLERDVQLGGLVLPEAERLLEELSRKVVREPRVVVTVLSSYSQSVFTYGRIASRAVELNTPLRILQLMAQVGGPLEGAIQDSVRVISADGTVRLFNYRKVNRTPDSGENFLLKPGDIVFVPTADDFTVMVFGEVGRTGAYRMQYGDRLLDVLVKAGSWTASADVAKARLLRPGRSGRVETIQTNLKRLFEHGDDRMNHPLQDGDIVYIPAKGAPRLQPTYTFLSILYMLLTGYTLYDSLKD